MRPPLAAAAAPAPDDLVVMGAISGAFGVRGWVKLLPHTETPGSLCEYETWWLDGPAGWSPHRVEETEVHGAALVAKLAGCDDREVAARMRGRQVAVPRSAFPAAGEHEYYQSDLIGLGVVNTSGEHLGRVVRVIETGANDVLVLEGERERLIPFIEPIVLEVDLAKRAIRVDWGVDY